MAFKNLIVSAVAAAGVVAAQSSSCSTTASFTIQNQGDADALSGCATVTGSIAIQTSVTSAIDLGPIQKITGDLLAVNTVQMPSFAGSSLKQIGGNFQLTNMTLLTNLAFPMLTSVGNINWDTLPRLTSLAFTKGVTSAGAVSIQDTQLGSLDGLSFSTVSSINIISNNQLNSINFPITSMENLFAVAFNGRSMSIQLPNLKVANNMTFSNVTTLAIPALAGTNGSIGFYGCSFQSLSMPNLTQVGGDITFSGNDDLTNVTAPQLTSLTGALTMSSNAGLQDINGFPELAQITGAIDINGNFTNVTLPALKNVRGACNLQSTQPIDSTCSAFNSLKSSGTIQGKVTCVGKESNPGGLGSTASGTSGSASSTSTHTGAAARELYARSAAVTGVMGVFAALLGML